MQSAFNDRTGDVGEPLSLLNEKVLIDSRQQNGESSARASTARLCGIGPENRDMVSEIYLCFSCLSRICQSVSFVAAERSAKASRQVAARACCDRLARAIIMKGIC